MHLTFIQGWLYVFIIIIQFNNAKQKFNNNIQKLKYAASFVSGVVITASIISIGWNPLLSFQTVDDIPALYFQNKKVLTGSIVRVIDGDTFKFQPETNFLQKLFKSKSSKSLTVRIAGIDTPELAKKGLQGQKYSEEAASFALHKLKDKQIKLTLLKKDRYNRILGSVRYKDGFNLNADIAEELLREGLAIVYRGNDAEYNGRYEDFLKLEEDAIKRKRKIWENGRENADLPQDFKKKVQYR